MTVAAPARRLRLALVSDVHLEFADWTFPPTDADVVIAAGDFLPIRRGNAVEWLAQQVPDRPVLFVPGNHDYYGGFLSQTEEAWRQAAQGTNVQVLINDAVTIEGVQFLGTPFFSDLSMPGRWPLDVMKKVVETNIADFGTIRKSATERWRAADMVKAGEQARAFLDAHLPAADATGVAPVVITHWAPAEGSITPQFVGDALNPYFILAAEDLVARAQTWLHGHTHSPSAYRVGERLDRGQVYNNPRGYVYRDGRQERAGVYAPLLIEVEKTG